MQKTLASGITIDDKQFYELLIWKDNHPREFELFVQEHKGIETKNGIVTKERNYSIGYFDRDTYNKLVKFADI